MITAMNRTLEDTFNVCPECSAPWSLHWVSIQDGDERKRRWNTCGWWRDQLEAKWLQ